MWCRSSTTTGWSRRWIARTARSSAPRAIPPRCAIFSSPGQPLPIMPSAQAALIALRGLRTDIADAVLERARHYYTAPLDLGPSPRKS